MGFSYQIEVAVTRETSTTERGRILERFAQKLLHTQNYSVTENVRLTASEVDLLGKEKTTGETIFVECKAFRSNLSAEVLQKLLGNVHFKRYSSGWLISTFSLGKDAKGFEHEWQQRPPEERRQLRIYSPDTLIALLVSAKLVVGADTLQFDRNRFKAADEAYLLLTQDGEFWALPIIDPASGIRSAALLFRADTGEQIFTQAILDRISSTDTSVALPWISETTELAGTATKLRSELESIVRVPMADHWADYRPARPEDFVGREAAQATIFRFLDAVRAGTTSTRLLALKGPSGWGKSSSLLKIASRAGNVRNRRKYFVFAVDSRAAITRRFPELAVATAIKEAVKNGFISEQPAILEFGSASSLFSANVMDTINDELRKSNKVVCIFFDQFEELLYKADLVDVFDEMRRICSSLEEAQSNIVIGFSWKTDGVIPTEHSAYHMWHALSDRRFEIELAPFSEAEVGLAINRFAKELGYPLIPQLRRVLQDHCQGFPWLLKKLCVHVLQLSRAGTEQADILTSSLNIQTLFKRDLEALSSTEIACLKQIATESPAEFFKISQNFGDEVVARLVDKRLIIRSGTRLTLYWDIFRDYLLTEKIPYIPVTYIPQANFNRHIKALAYMMGKHHLSYGDLAKAMNLGMGATDNLVRDLVNLGHVEANRKENLVYPAFSDEQRAIEITFSFWRSHEVVRHLLSTRPNGETFSEGDFQTVYRGANKRSEIGEDTVHAYSQRILRWLIGIGLVQQRGEAFVLLDALRSPVTSLESIAKKTRHSLFLGEAPPQNVISAFSEIRNGLLGRRDIEARHGRNTCYALINLGLLTVDGHPKVGRRSEPIEEIVRKHAIASATLTFVCALDFHNMSGLELGEQLSVQLRTGWARASKQRYGSALKQWAAWAIKRTEPDLFCTADARTSI
ncbi:hypothetical protein SLNSH_19320 [Alsobacter soli]|uniref:Uncharacterized protein n=1 Tax=Alsobacter soli TaxID=2109933 RepID=A0A2T1HNV6_9HYPH|nr:restriction endonuclease [Alsobacter soli]PSC03316.1 hypothetical protein SLNSH_19320 [Alsobacter soli]